MAGVTPADYVAGDMTAFCVDNRTDLMRTELSRFLWALPLALLIVLLGRSADDSARPARNRLDAIYLKGRSQWHSLDALIDTAWDYLTSKTNVPAAERGTFVVWIDGSDTNQLVLVSFGAGIGKPFWEIKVGAGGQAQGYKTGSVADGHRTFGPKDK